MSTVEIYRESQERLLSTLIILLMFLLLQFQLYSCERLEFRILQIFFFIFFCQQKRKDTQIPNICSEKGCRKQNEPSHHQRGAVVSLPVFAAAPFLLQLWLSMFVHPIKEAQPFLLKLSLLFFFFSYLVPFKQSEKHSFLNCSYFL